MCLIIGVSLLMATDIIFEALQDFLLCSNIHKMFVTLANKSLEISKQALLV